MERPDDERFAAVMKLASTHRPYQNACLLGGFEAVCKARRPLVIGVLVALWLTAFGQAQVPSGIRDISRLPSGDFLLRAAPEVPNPDILVLQSSISPAGPWWTVSEQQRTPVPGGYEFLVPFKSYQSRQFYRLGLYGTGGSKPHIRFIAPSDQLQLGQAVTLHGDNFAETPVGNTVTFSLLSGLVSNATVLSATRQQIVLTVPDDLEVPPSDPAIVYRVNAAGSSSIRHRSLPAAVRLERSIRCRHRGF